MGKPVEWGRALKALGAIAVMAAVLWGVMALTRLEFGTSSYRVYPPGIVCDSVQTTSTGCLLAYKDGMRIALVCGSYAVVTED